MPSMTVVTPLALVVAMAMLELYASRLQRADAEQRDRGSLLVIWTLVGLGYWAGFTLWRRPPGPLLGEWALWAGAAIAIAGMGLRLWSVLTLGRYFTYVVRVTADQPVVETGPYRLLRHPSYAGGILTGIGIGLSLRYALGPLVVGLPMAVGYLVRIRVEERALAEAIGAPYRAYMGRTKRIIPFVW